MNPGGRKSTAPGDTWPQRRPTPWCLLLGCLLWLLTPAAALASTRGETTPMQHLLATGQYDEAVDRAIAEDKGSYLHELIHRARQARLADEPQWRALLHYRKSLLGGYLSEVDGASFFTSKQGFQDPERELLATLASFFSSRPVPGTIHPTQCRFIARYTWLKEKLDFDPSRLPELPCKGFDVLYRAIQPVGLTVVFPSAHPNSPSSMFGHTLIRIDGKGHSQASRMLDYTINYAAEADTRHGITYAIKGLTGGFIGRFHIIPYHMKLREYAQMENRDIWEYKLKVSQKTVDQVLMHAWELLGTHFDYYFFTENCSYHVLSLLESDLYDEHLTDEFNAWVLPTDTLRVLERHGLIEHVDYYPSSYRRILARRKQLNHEEERLARQIHRQGLESAKTMLAAMPARRQAAVLDMAYDYLRYEKIAAGQALKPGLSQRERQLLLARSHLQVASSKLDIERPGVRPDQGHDSARISIGGGSGKDGGYIHLGWRAVYHDWLDPSGGYSTNYALEFGKLAVRYYGDGQLRLEQAYLVNLDNFEPLDDIFHQISWHVTTGLEPVFNAEDNRKVAFMVRGGPGASFRPGGGSWLIYTGIDGESAYGPGYHGNYYLGIGPAAAMMLNGGSDWRIRLNSRYLLGLGLDKHDRALFSLEQSWRINKDASLNVGASRIGRKDGWRTEANIWLNLYY